MELFEPALNLSLALFFHFCFSGGGRGLREWRRQFAGMASLSRIYPEPQVRSWLASNLRLGSLLGRGDAGGFYSVVKERLTDFRSELAIRAAGSK